MNKYIISGERSWEYSYMLLLSCEILHKQKGFGHSYTICTTLLRIWLCNHFAFSCRRDSVQSPGGNLSTTQAGHLATFIHAQSFRFHSVFKLARICYCSWFLLVSNFLPSFVLATAPSKKQNRIAFQFFQSKACARHALSFTKTVMDKTNFSDKRRGTKFLEANKSNSSSK